MPSAPPGLLFLLPSLTYVAQNVAAKIKGSVFHLSKFAVGESKSQVLGTRSQYRNNVGCLSEHHILIDCM